MENDKKAMIQTVIISLLMCLTRLLVIPSEINFIFQNIFRGKEKAYIFLIWIPISALYYFVVMRERKSDKFYDSNKKRIKCSMLILFFGMLIYVSVVSVFTQLSSDVHHLELNILLYIMFQIQPLLIHLSGCLFQEIFIKVPKIICNKLKNKK